MAAHEADPIYGVNSAVQLFRSIWNVVWVCQTDRD